MEVELGRKVKCKVTGFVGVAIARTVFINGCARITVQPPVDKDGKHPDALYIDETAIEYVGKTKIDVGEKHQRGGASTKVMKEKVLKA